MKIFKSEYLNNYNTYSFGYSEYAIKESEKDINDIYRKGFLPYTGNIDINYSIFYLARSLRVDLSIFVDSSENKRVNRKLNAVNNEIIRYNLKDFNFKNEKFLKFCLEYVKVRFSGNSMTRDRLLYILNSDIATDIFEFKDFKTDKILGYILAVVTKDTFHYWFSFYDFELINKFPLGKWMMWKMIKWSLENNIKYVYLGTGYGVKSLYKIRDFKGIEFFDGNGWNQDIILLKSLCDSDDLQKEEDYFKTIENPNDLIKKIL